MLYAAYHWNMDDSWIISYNFYLKIELYFSAFLYLDKYPNFGSKLPIFITVIYLMLKNPDEEIEIIDNFTDTS